MAYFLLIDTVGSKSMMPKCTQLWVGGESSKSAYFGTFDQCIVNKWNIL